MTYENTEQPITNADDQFSDIRSIIGQDHLDQTKLGEYTKEMEEARQFVAESNEWENRFWDIKNNLPILSGDAGIVNCYYEEESDRILDEDDNIYSPIEFLTPEEQEKFNDYIERYKEFVRKSTRYGPESKINELKNKIERAKNPVIPSQN